MTSFTAYSSPSDDNTRNINQLEKLIPNEIIVDIASMMDDKDIGQLTQTNTQTKNLLSRNSNQGGKKLREDSKFSVTDDAGNIYFLDEFLLLPGRMKISHVNNIDLLIKERPNDFNNLILKTIPNTPAEIENNLESYFRDVVKIEDLVAGMPQYESAHEKLAALLVDTIIYMELIDQVTSETRDQVWKQLKDQVWVHISEQVNIQNRGPAWAQLGTQFWYSLRSKVWQQIRSKFNPRSWNEISENVWLNLRNNVSEDVWDNIRLKAWEQIRFQVQSQIRQNVNYKAWENFKNFNFSLSTQSEDFSKKIRNAIDYVYSVNQLGVISMAHSSYLKPYISEPNGLFNYIKNNLTESEAQNILDSIHLSNDFEDQYFRNIQFDILKRHLPQ